jgi:multimeric flavodoxin WrbA
MKVVAFNGSPRVHGNTAQSIQIALKELEKEGIETEIVQLGGRKVFGGRHSDFLNLGSEHGQTFTAIANG